MAEKWQKVIPATGRKRGQARQKGQFPKSQELSIAVGLLTLLVILVAVGPSIFRGIGAYFEESFARASGPLTLAEGIRLLRLTLWRTMVLVAPALTLALVGGVIVGVYETRGLSFSGQRIRLDIAKLNPASGAKKILSVQGLAKLGTSILKLAAIAGVLIWTVYPRMDEILELARHDLQHCMRYGATVLFLILLRVTLLLFVIAFLDKRFQSWKYEQDLKMTREEHKEEMKSVEGNPRVKKQIWAMMRKMLQQRMIENTDQADVVVTNPMRFAVALRYTPGDGGAPKVVAKGMNRMAARIRDLARKHDIPLVENPALARALYRMCQVGTEIPEKLYRPVAELLAYVFKLRDRQAARRKR